MSNLKVSIVLCTHNRAALLRQVLESLANQTIDRAWYEIVVVDNRSTDDTQKVIEGWKQSKPSCQLKLVYEPALGLGYARNTGWRNARGGYIAFIDDDAKADAHWLERALELFESLTPAPVAVGGLILPFYLCPKPVWYKDEYEVRSWGDTPRYLTKGESFSGSNMIFAREILQRLEGFDVRVGMKGNQLSVGEETTLFRKIWTVMGDQAPLYYSPRLIVCHAVCKQRLLARHHLTRWFVAGQVACLLDGPVSWRERLHRMRMTLIAIRTLTASALEQRRMFSDYRAWVVERLGPVALEVGRLLAGFGICVPLRRRNICYLLESRAESRNLSMP